MPEEQTPPAPKLDELNPILALLRTRTQYDFRCYRKNMLMRRVQRRIRLYHLRETADYLAYLRANPEEVTALYKDLLIGVTHFFGEPEACQFLVQRVVPELIERRDAEVPVRVWVPGCATGEDAYSIAILLLEGFADLQKPPNIQIFGTDIDEGSLESARNGVYPESIAADVSAERLKRFFIRTDEHKYQVSKQLRESVVFASQNLISDAPFSRLDLISCRSLLIYLEPDVQAKVIRLFHFALKEDGNLLLGPSQTIGPQVDLFEPISKKWRVYRRIGPVHRALETTKEELQSLNTELRTLNNQLQDKVNELDKTNKDMTNLLASTGIATIFLDPGKRLRQFTPPAVKLLNLIAADIGRPIGDFSSRLINSKLLFDVDCVLERLIPMEKEVHTEDGECYLQRITPHRTQDNRIEGVVMTFVDISRRTRVERELKSLNETLERQVAERTAALSKREQEFHALADNVPARFCYLDADEVYRYVNRRCEVEFGRSSADIVGKRMEEILGPQLYASARPHIQMVLSGEEVQFQVEAETTKGPQTFQITYMPDFDQAKLVKGFFALVSDITARRQAQEKVRLLSQVVEQSPVSVMVTDPDARIQYVNAAFERVFGYPANEAQGQHLYLLIPVLDRETPERAFRQFVDSGHQEIIGNFHEVLGRRKDGSLFPLELMFTSVDHLGLFVGLLRDISERKTLEQEIIQISTFEQERIGRDIHDGIGQQLTGLTMLASSLARKLENAKRPLEALAATQLVEHLQRAAEEAKSLSQGLSPVEIPPEGLIEALSTLVDRTQSTSGIRCRLTAPRPVPGPHQFDAIHLYRIAQEATNNAIKHANAENIEIGLEDKDLDLVLSVRDDGVGIKPMEDRRGRLGLHIMHYRCDIIGGKLKIEPLAGGGTLVQCTLPKKQSGA